MSEEIYSDVSGPLLILDHYISDTLLWIPEQEIGFLHPFLRAVPSTVKLEINGKMVLLKLHQN